MLECLLKVSLRPEAVAKVTEGAEFRVHVSSGPSHLKTLKKRFTHSHRNSQELVNSHTHLLMIENGFRVIPQQLIAAANVAIGTTLLLSDNNNEK